MVVDSIACHDRAIPLLRQALDHPSVACYQCLRQRGGVDDLLEKADRLLAGFGAITLLADRAFPEFYC